MATIMSMGRLRRLGGMTADELFARSKAAAIRWYETACYSVGLDGGLELPVRGHAATFRGPWIDERAQRDVVVELLARHQRYSDEIVRAADAICRHEFSFFGRVVRYGEQIAWQDDPVSQKPWPRAFHTRVRIFGGDAGHGDVKYVWELNRHQFLPVLGKAYCLTGDEKYASAGLAMVDSWIAANPFGVGINWTSALEVAVRSLSWCWACALFENSDSLTPSRRHRILRSLVQHARYIERHLSFYFSPYNHLVGEATALFAIGSLFPRLRASGRWRDRGWKILDDEVLKQFHPDGGSVEQATGYHHFTLGFYLQAVLLKRRLGGEIGARMRARLERAFDFSMHMMRPDGSTPMVGDADEGKALSLQQPDLWDFRVFLALGAVLFGRGDFKMTGGGFPPDAAWLLGAEGWERYRSVHEVAPSEASTALPDSGYYIMRTGWEPDSHYLAFDCGEISAGVSAQDTPSAAHGHADTLSVEVAAFGAPALVDPGFWTYNGGLDWHRYFRETEAHNTVVVDDRSQAEFRGRLKWSHAPLAEVREWITLGSLDYAEGSHSGYQRLRPPVVHRRAVVFLKPDYWVLRDELCGEGEHSADRHFHFATPEVAGTAAPGGVQTRLGGRPGLAVVPVECDGVALALTREGEAPGSGWLAVGYEHKVRAAVAKYRSVSKLPCALHTLLVPFRGDSCGACVSLLPLESDAGSPLDRAFVVSRPGGRDMWVFSSGGMTRFHDGWVTDARLAVVRTDEAGRVTGCVLVSGSRLDVNGQPLLRVDRPVRAATLSVTAEGPVVELAEAAQVHTSVPGRPLVLFPQRAGSTPR